MGKEKEGSSPAQTWPDCGRGSAGLATEKRKKKRRLKPGGLSRAEKERPGTCRGALWNNESEIGLRNQTNSDSTFSHSVRTSRPIIKSSISPIFKVSMNLQRYDFPFSQNV